MHEIYSALYRDQHGEERATIENNGKQLRLIVRGVKFTGSDFDSLEPAPNEADERMASFALD